MRSVEFILWTPGVFSRRPIKIQFFWDELVNDLSHGSQVTVLLQHEEADSAILVRAYEKYSVVLGFSEDQTICATHLEVSLKLTKLKHVNTQR